MNPVLDAELDKELVRRSDPREHLGQNAILAILRKHPDFGGRQCRVPVAAGQRGYALVRVGRHPTPNAGLAHFLGDITGQIVNEPPYWLLQVESLGRNEMVVPLAAGGTTSDPGADGDDAPRRAELEELSSYSCG